METFGSAEPAPEEQAKGWDTPFPASPTPSFGTASWQERMAARDTCDGTDRHRLSLSPRAKAVFCGAATVLLALAAVTRSSLVMTYGVAMALVAVLAVGYSLWVDGDTLVSRRYGTTKRTPLEAIVRVERYTYRGGTSLRTWRADGHRSQSIPVSGRLFRLDRRTAGHLRRYLDRGDVSWGPGAWELLTGEPARAAAVATPEQDASPASEPGAPSGPKGVQLPGKPLSRSKRILGWVSLGAMGAVGIVFVVLAPVAWTKYQESQRIQHGPETTAVLQREWITEYSDRSGTHHTTHFDVVFDTGDQQLVTTQVDAPGTWTIEPRGDRLSIRYDPSSPIHAELPGAPDNTLAGAIVPTVGAVVICGVTTATLVGMRRVRRRTKVLLEGSRG